LKCSLPVCRGTCARERHNLDTGSVWKSPPDGFEHRWILPQTPPFGQRPPRRKTDLEDAIPKHAHPLSQPFSRRP
jgi:hypothetical protein